LYDVKDAYGPQDAPLPGAKVRLVLGATPDWQSPGAGHSFVTDEKGEAHFTMPGLIDKQWISQNVGFTPFSIPVRTEHMQIAVELDHELPLETGVKTVRWVLTMDLNCEKGGRCSTSDFMGIYTPDAKGNFSKPLVRQGGQEAWAVPELHGMILRGMSYQCARFLMSADENDPNKRTLELALKRMPRPRRH
jgi:hypothetical protein